MSSNGGVLARNSSSNKNGGLQLSRERRVVQNTQRSFRGLGSNHQPKKPSLGANLARIDSKRGLGSNRKAIDDDLSIDDTFVSTTEEPKKSAVDNFFANKTGAIKSTRRKDSQQKKDANLKRLPPRRKTFDDAAAVRQGMDDLSKSEHDNCPPKKTRGDSLSKSNHVPRSAAKQRKHSSINSSKDGATAHQVMDDLSNSEHDTRPQEKTLKDSLSKSEHVPRTAAAASRSRSNMSKSKDGATVVPVMDDVSESEHNNHTIEKTPKDSLFKSDHVPNQKRPSSINESMPRNKQQPSIQGIYKIIDSMDNSSPTSLTAGGGTTATAADTSISPFGGPPTGAQRRLPRRSKTADFTTDSNSNPIAVASLGSGLRGIKNLIDQTDLNGSPKEVAKNDSPKEPAKDSRPSPKEAPKEKVIVKNDSSTQKDSSQSIEQTTARSDNFGANQRVSVQGIYRLMGSMNPNNTINTSLSPPMKDKDIAGKPSDGLQKARAATGSTRRLQVQENLNRLASAKEDEDDVLDRREKVRQARIDSRKKLLAESSGPAPAPAPAPVVSAVEEHDNKVDTAAADDDETGDDQNNDYDTVATPKTALGPPPAPMKEAPPPPQRKNMARRPRNQLPSFAPQKPSTSSFKSAPTRMQKQVPATPVRSPGGFVIEMQNKNDPTSTPMVTNTPQQNHNTPNLVTPQAVTMPVMPSNDFDSVSTPCSIVRPPAPPMAKGPPPPPKRNMDVGGRWKSRQYNKPPTAPGQNGQKDNNDIRVMGTQSFATKAPVLSSISPGGIVIEVNAPSGVIRSHLVPEPMTPSVRSAGGGDVKPGGYRNTPGSHRSTPGGKHFRGLPVQQTPLRRSRYSDVSDQTLRRSRHSDVSDESSLRTPSTGTQPMSDISELTAGTFAGSVYGTTPTRETPRSQAGSVCGTAPTRETPRSQAEGPQTPSLYTSPGGGISELTPGGYSIGLYGDEDYKSSSRQHSSSSAQMMSTPSAAAQGGFPKNQLLTPGTYGILLEEVDEDGEVVAPSTPMLQSPAGLVSELTPGTYGINMLDEDNNSNGRGGDNMMQRQTRRACASSQYPVSILHIGGVDDKEEEEDDDQTSIPITPTSGPTTPSEANHVPSERFPPRRSNSHNHSVVSELTSGTYSQNSGSAAHYSQSSGSTGQVVA